MKLIAFIIAFLHTGLLLSGQDYRISKNRLSLYTNFSAAFPDKRLFDFSNSTVRREILKNGKKSFDLQLDFGVQKLFLQKRKWNTGIGAGLYSKICSFPRPFSKLEFGNYTLEGRYIEVYLKHGIQTRVFLKRAIKSSSQAYFFFSFDSNFNILKWMSDTKPDDRLVKWGFDFDNMDINAAVGRGKKIKWQLQLRLLNFSKIDYVVINGSMFKKHSPRLLRRGFDFYTLPKLGLSIVTPLSKN